MKQIRLRTIGLIYGGFLLLIGLSLIVGSLYVHQRIIQVGQLWFQFRASHSEKAEVLNALNRDIGYGGMIHHFKEMVLRRDATHAAAVQASLGGALAALERYHNLDATPSEMAALDQLAATLNNYREATLNVAPLLARGLSAEDIDYRLHIDDEAFLRALDQLEAESLPDTAGSVGKVDLLNRLSRYLGYGGMIHQFHDYLLRKDAPRAVLVQTKLAEALGVVNSYERLSINTSEQKALGQLRHVLQNYQEAVLIAKELIAQKTPSAELVRYAAVDDTLALAALRTLKRENVAQATQDASLLQAGLAVVSSLALGNAMLTPVLIWLLICASAWLLRSQIIRPLTRLTDAMMRLSQGQLDVDVVVSGGAQEIRQLATATQSFKEKSCELIAAEKRIRQILDSMPDPVVMVNEQGCFVMVNSRTEEVFGYSREQLLGSPVEILLPLHQQQQHKKRMMGFWQTPYAQSMISNRDVCAVAADGRQLPVDINLVPIQTDQGTLILASIRDISAHKQIEAALMEERSLIYSLVGSIRDIIFWKDVNGVYQGCNPAFTRAFGKTEQELIGLTDFDLYPQEIAESNWKQEQHLLKSGKPFQDEQTCTMTDGREVILDTVLTPYTDETGKLLGILGVSRDITQYKEMTNWLARSKEQADAANQAKGEFLANMSHDIRTPMNAIIGLSQLALDTALTPQQHDYVEKIYSAAQNLLGIINDILDFSKIDAGKMHMEVIDFDLTKVLEYVGQVVGQMAAEKGLEIAFDYPSDLPIALLGDPLRLGQVLTNLVNNAVKFTEHGEVVISIEAYEQSREQVRLRFTVRDTGIGISAAQQAQLFKPFSQADASTTRRHGGTGLGLVICQRLVAMMDGHIGVDSELGQGSAFHFTARFALSHQSLDAPKMLPETLYKLRTLVVDDNAVVRNLLYRFLSNNGLLVDVAASAAETIEKMTSAQASGQPYRLLLVDGQLPDASTVQLAQRLHRNCAAHGTVGKALVMKNHASDPLCTETDRRHLDGFITKPITQSVLLDQIIALFSSNNQGKAAQIAVNPTQDQSRFQGLRILVVEDNPVNQQIAREFLNKAGMVVWCADNGQTALLLLQQKSFDGVLMDMHMPEMDGLEVTRRMRQLPALANLPIIAMTANAMSEDRERCLAVGMNDHIAKPISMALLYETLAKWLPPAHTDQTAEEDADVMLPSSPAIPAMPLPPLNGIDTAQGLAQMGGDLALYQTLLLMFHDNQKDCIAQLRQALTHSDQLSAQTIVHTLKSIAANIGATSLTKAAATLEFALKQSVLPNELVFLIANVERQLNEILTALAEWTAQYAHDHDDDDSEPDHAPFKKLHQILIAEKSGAMLAAINAASAAERLNATESFAEVQRMVGEFDYPGAAKRLEALAEELQIDLRASL